MCWVGSFSDAHVKYDQRLCKTVHVGCQDRTAPLPWSKKVTKAELLLLHHVSELAAAVATAQNLHRYLGRNAPWEGVWSYAHMEYV